MSIDVTEHFLLQNALAFEEDLVAFRRHLHSHPERTGNEVQTTQFIAERCRDLGLEPQIAGESRGLWCDVGQGDARTLVRGDIDALPIQTTLQTDYRSRNDGVMHACGHDVHATCVFGALRLLRDRAESDASVSARFCFQPAEEDSTGARHMISAGVLRGVGRAIALHTDPGRPVGTVGVRDGAFTASCRVFELTVRGRGGHGARPFQTDDVLMAATAWLHDAALQVPRRTNNLHPVVFNVGSFHAGDAANVVPDAAALSGTLRATNRHQAETAWEVLQRITRLTADRFGCGMNLTTHHDNPPLVNDPGLTAAIGDAARSVLGSPNVVAMNDPSMGAEDFAFFSDHVPAAMFRLGIADGDGRVGHHGLHTSNFDVDERCLAVGAAVLAETVRTLVAPSNE